MYLTFKDAKRFYGVGRRQLKREIKNKNVRCKKYGVKKYCESIDIEKILSRDLHKMQK